MPACGAHDQRFELLPLLGQPLVQCPAVFQLDLRCGDFLFLQIDQLLLLARLAGQFEIAAVVLQLFVAQRQQRLSCRDPHAIGAMNTVHEARASGPNDRQILEVDDPRRGPRSGPGKLKAGHQQPGQGTLTPTNRSVASGWYCCRRCSSRAT